MDNGLLVGPNRGFEDYIHTHPPEAAGALAMMTDCSPLSAEADVAAVHQGWTKGPGETMVAGCSPISAEKAVGADVVMEYGPLLEATIVAGCGPASPEQAIVAAVVIGYGQNSELFPVGPEYSSYLLIFWLYKILIFIFFHL